MGHVTDQDAVADDLGVEARRSVDVPQGLPAVAEDDADTEGVDACFGHVRHDTAGPQAPDQTLGTVGIHTGNTPESREREARRPQKSTATYSSFTVLRP